MCHYISQASKLREQAQFYFALKAMHGETLGIFLQDGAYASGQIWP